MRYNSIKSKKFEVFAEFFENSTKFEIRNTNFIVINIFVPVYPKNMIKISSNRAFEELCKELFGTQFGDIVANI